MLPIDYLSIADSIHTQLEILKYIGGIDATGKPTGEGILLNIVTLPDLIMDIRKYNIKSPQKIDRICAVGGRSARTACILAHLIDEYDGIYIPHLITKTGNLGKLLIENEFYLDGKDDSSDLLVQKKLEKHIIERLGEPRCTIWNSRNKFFPNSYHDDYELSKKDIIENSEIGEILFKASTIYLSSIKFPNFEEIFKMMINDDWKSVQLHPYDKNIFLDCTRSDENHLKVLVELLNEDENKSEKIAGIIISEEEEKILQKVINGMNYKLYFKNKNIPIIFYSSRNVFFINDEGVQKAEINLKNKDRIHFRDEDIPERFKAGFLLSFSLYNAIEMIKNDPYYNSNEVYNEIFDEFQQFWSDNPWEKMIAYGMFLSKSTNNSNGQCSMKELLNGSDIHFPSNAFNFPGNIFERDDNNPFKIKFNQPVITHLAKLAGFRRLDKLSYFDLPMAKHEICKNNKECKYYNYHKIRKLEDYKPEYAILIDLDGTLLNSKAQRNKALINAFNWLHSYENNPSNHFISDSNPFVLNQELPNPLDFFEKYVYSSHELYFALGYGDFRQVWNHPGWYVTYMILYTDIKLAKTIRNDCIQFQTLKSDNARTTYINKIVWKKDLKLHLIQSMKKISN